MSEVRELIIIGSGPAGYTAGVYAARAQLQPLLFAGEQSGGQLMNTTLVENWPGSKDGIMGPDLMMDMRAQAEKFGTQILDRHVTRVDFSSEEFKKVYVGDPSTSSGHVEYLAKAVIVATGAKSRMTGVPGEDRLLGRGVAVCAVCDAAFYRDKKTFVIGGGDAAVEDAMALTKFASSVTMLIRSDKMRASKIMQERAENEPKITIMYNTQIKEVLGDQKVEKIVVTNENNEDQELLADGVFVAIGHVPVTSLFNGQLDLDEKGYLMTHLNGTKSEVAEDVWLKGYPTMTSATGVFAAGDVVDFRYRQAITSAGMGCMAALDAEKYLTGHSVSY